MSKKLKQFSFYINYADIDLYCFWLIDTFGEDAKFIQLIDDNNFMEQCDNPKKYKKNADELLLEIRQCLVDNGFEKEIAACDEAFAKERANRGRENPYIAMHKRLEMDAETAENNS